ncbi:MAG: sugar phosphate isomerase/epimerase [Verrucomicrobiales bacterium]|nr:sugar phosphate isomerase/epimerase [Verrucomicrobiales bacterium]
MQGDTKRQVEGSRLMPRLAAFPKAYMHELCRNGQMTVLEWLDVAAGLEIEGVEWYAGFLENADKGNWVKFRRCARDRGLEIPMLCCSPDFTHHDAGFRAIEVQKEKGWIEMAAELGAEFCRVLSGQRRPGLSREEGLGYAADAIIECAHYAESMGVRLVIENHYKDDFWDYPEFAQQMDVFCELVGMINHSCFGVNYDPSNTFLAGEDPIELLGRVKSRVVTMHASDRYLREGSLEDLRLEEIGVEGYAERLCHGEIGAGLNDYDEIFRQLRSVEFDGWISIEDGVEGVDQLKRSVAFLRRKIARYW